MKSLKNLIARLVRSPALLLTVALIGSCTSMPEYSETPLGADREAPANPLFAQTPLALVYSENTIKTISYLEGIKAIELNFFVERKEDYNPHPVLEQLHRMLEKRFSKVLDADSMDAAKKLDVDLFLVFDFRFRKGDMSGQTTTVDFTGVFLTRNDMTIDTITGEGIATIPTPYDVSLKPAASSALAQFFNHLDSSAYLMAELNRRDQKQGIAASAVPAPAIIEVPEPSTANSGEDAAPITGAEAAAIDFGAYHALVIGNDDYVALPRLRTAVSDAQAVSTVLVNEYGFRTQLLLNATRAEILRAITGYRRTLGPHDNLLIYYAGHGWLDRQADQGYWLPVDATEEDPTNWISNGAITDSLRAMDALHVLVVADSCYSGKMVRGVNIRLQSRNYFERIVRKKSRTVMASGGLEPVFDEGAASGHSAFASALLNALDSNEGIIDATLLFTKVRRPVMLSADQTPEYSDIRRAGHDGGDFVFVRRATN